MLVDDVKTKIFDRKLGFLLVDEYFIFLNVVVVYSVLRVNTETENRCQDLASIACGGT